MEGSQIDKRLTKMRTAYQSLYLGSDELLEMNSAYWTEQILLKIIKRISINRIKQLNNVLSGIVTDEDKNRLRKNMLEAQATAALGGHNLEEWEVLDDNKGFQATCSLCGGSVFVNHSTLYSILTDTCLSDSPTSLDDER